MSGAHHSIQPTEASGSGQSQFLCLPRLAPAADAGRCDACVNPAGLRSSVEQRTMKVPRPNRSKLQRAIKRRDKQRRNWCRRCPFCAPSGRCLDTTIRSGRCGDWVFYLLPGGKQCRRRWVRPKDPLTPAQVRNRTRLAAASRKYSAVLTDREQDAFIAAGAKRRSRPRLGQSGPLTGQQYSVRKDVHCECTRKSAEYRNSCKSASTPEGYKTHMGTTPG